MEKNRKTKIEEFGDQTMEKVRGGASRPLILGPFCEVCGTDLYNKKTSPDSSLCEECYAKQGSK